MTIKDKVFVLTGVARIGKDVAKALADRGAKLAVCYVSKQPDLSNLAAEIEYFQGDLSDSRQVARITADIKQRFGRIDALVHMAANYKRSPFSGLSEKDWDESMNPIAKSALLMTKAVADQMTEGRIVLISDWSVQSQPYKDYLVYNMAKAAVEGLTKSLAKELAPKILVNCIAPGPIIRPPDLDPSEDAEVLKNTPLERWGGGEEIAKAVLYFIESDFTTGAILPVDGGRSIA